MLLLVVVVAVATSEKFGGVVMLPLVAVDAAAIPGKRSGEGWLFYCRKRVGGE